MTTEVHNTARALVERAVGGDGPAAGELVERLMPIVRARVFRTLRRTHARVDTATLDDLVQEVWAALFAGGGRRLLAYDPTRGASLEHFVGVLAEREVAMLQRSTRTQRRGAHLRLVELTAAGEVPSGDGDPQSHAVATELATKLGDHLGRSLPETGLLVLRYAFRDGVEPPAVARILGVDVQVVYNWQHKIRRLAREFLAQ